MSRLRSSSWLSNYYLGKYGASSYPYHSYPFAYGGALRISPYLSPVPTLFVAAPSGAYGAASAELDWTDVRLSGAADEGYLCETASEAVKVINEFLNDKWAHLPNVQIIFSGLASDPDNVWEFKDGSVLPFSQVREKVARKSRKAMIKPSVSECFVFVLVFVCASPFRFPVSDLVQSFSTELYLLLVRNI